jgi:hypothetical protein
MPTNIKIINAQDFVRAAPRGQFDFEMTKNLLMEIASAATSLADFEIIIDTRNAQATLSATDLWYLACELSNLRKTFFHRKTAVLCPLDRFDQAAFFALCAQNEGFQVKAFASYEDAMEWLLAAATKTALGDRTPRR